MPEQHAFALKDNVKDFSGGSIALGPEGETVDLKARLDNGGGVIVTDDPLLAHELEQLGVFKSVPVPSGKGSKGGSD